MIFKTWLTDLTKIQGVINNIKSIELLANDTTGLLNPSTVNNLSSAIAGLTLQQAQLALSTRNLTQEQMNQVLVQAGLVASENKIQAELVQSALVQAGLSAEKQKEILSELDLMDVTTGEILTTQACTKEKLLNMLATQGVTGANAEEIISALEQTGANGAATISFELLTASIWANIKALAKWLVTNPAGWAILAVTGIIGLVKIINVLTVSVEEANGAMEEAEYESAKSSLESINSELEEQKKKLDELLKKDKLTYAEQGQLEELQAITKELLLQQDIEERRADKASREAAGKAINAYQKQYGKYNKTEDYLNKKLSYDPSCIIIENENNVLGNVAGYIRAQKLLEQMQNEYDGALAIGEDSALLDQNLQFCIDLMNDYSNAIDDNISDLQEKRLALEDEYNKAIAKRELGLEPLATFDKEVIETYESIYDLTRMIYESTDPNTWKSMQIENVFNTKGIEKTKEELIEMAKRSTLNESTIQSYSKLSSALEQNGVSASELCNELEALAEAGKNVKGDAFNVEPDSLSSALTSSQDSLDKFQSSVKSAADAYTTLLSGNYSSTELLDSIQAINQAATDMGSSIDWEDIDRHIRIL